MAELYLILHKVRGEPAFDIAIKENMGTPSDPGPWWGIPTSGHRAYPLRYWKLEELTDVSDWPHNHPYDYVAYDEIPQDEWEALRDHYIASEPLMRRGKFIEVAEGLGSTIRSILAGAGLIKPPKPIKRRRLR
jgi:hypothetical protein